MGEEPETTPLIHFWDFFPGIHKYQQNSGFYISATGNQFLFYFKKSNEDGIETQLSFIPTSSSITPNTTQKDYRWKLEIEWNPDTLQTTSKVWKINKGETEFPPELAPVVDETKTLTEKPVYKNPNQNMLCLQVGNEPDITDVNFRISDVFFQITIDQ